jgi:hypothetical protein
MQGKGNIQNFYLHELFVVQWLACVLCVLFLMYVSGSIPGKRAFIQG